MRIAGKAFIFCVGVGVLLLGGSLAARAESTLAAVKKRGQLVCGINGELPGFSKINVQKEWEGIEVELCRAIAAAVLGDAGKAKFVPLTAARRFDALTKGEIDVLVRNSTVTLDRTARTGVRDAGVYFIDGQSVAVAKKLGIARLAGLDKGTVCVLRGTPYEKDLQDWFTFRKLSVVPMMFDTQTAMYEAFFAGRCQGVTQDVSAIAGSVVASGKAADYLVLPETVATHPLAPFVRAGDDEWLDVVRWTIYAMLGAEERGVTRANVDEQRKAGSAAAQRLLGVTPGSGKSLGLDESWAYAIVKQVGNYGEVYERNVGVGSSLKFARGVNALWSAGGALYSPPLR